jgi:hypothetical protein
VAASTVAAAPGGADADSTVRTQTVGSSVTAPAAAFGKWTALGLTTQTTTPAVYEGPDHRAWVLWMTEPHTSQFTYEVAAIAPSGAIASAPSSIFGTKYWGSLSDQPTLVAGGAGPLAIFDGSAGSTGPYSYGCVVGTQEAASKWTLQPWSLSANCTNPVGGAAAGKGGVVAAAWSGGWSTGHGVLYRVGTSPSIPASGIDGHIAVTASGDAAQTAVASDTAGSGHFYVAYLQVFTSSHDGYYVKDVTANTASMRAPGSGTTSTNISPFAVPAMTSTNTHPGIFVVFCSNSSTCTVRLWRVGSSAVRVVPGSSGANDTAVSAGPDGRLWIAWYNESKNTVSVVRTNKADSAFGPVQTYGTACFEHGLLGLSGGEFGRLTMGLECVNQHAKLEMFVTQSVVPLVLSPGVRAIPNTAAHTVTFRVTDAGDAVVGATVVVHGKIAKTNAAGTVAFTFPKGTPIGKYPVAATAPNYATAHAVLSVVQ